MSDIILGPDGLELHGETVWLKRDAADTAAVRLSAENGNLVCGGQGSDGDILLHNRSGSLTIGLNGQRGSLHLGGVGQDGDITVYDNQFAQTVHVDGSTGDAEFGGEVSATDVRVSNDISVAGDVRARQFITRLIVQPSDLALKTDVVPMTEGLMAIQRLSPVRYAYSTEPERPRRGFVAQEVADVLPDIVQTLDDGHMALEPTALIPVLVKAVQELSNRVRELEGCLQELVEES